jgi:hypothetical protein
MKRKAVDWTPPHAPELNLDYLGKGFPALHDIRDNILLLSLGNAFLCEADFLRKTGNAVESQLDNLGQEILELKKRFPGKFTADIDTGSIIEDMRVHSQRLQNPDKEIIDKCTAGALGSVMEETLDSLTAALRTIKRKVEGETPAYTAKDSVLGVIDKARTPASMVTRLISTALKAAFIIILLSLGPLAYLALTMDREGALLQEIAESEAHILSQREVVGSIERQREALLQSIEAIKNEDSDREAKLELMEMNLKLYTLEQNRHRAETDISGHEETIESKTQKIREIREKPFLDRLLRKSD